MRGFESGTGSDLAGAKSNEDRRGHSLYSPALLPHKEDSSASGFLNRLQSELPIN
jgi:hypothetical protein